MVDLNYTCELPGSSILVNAGLYTDCYEFYAGLLNGLTVGVSLRVLTRFLYLFNTGVLIVDASLGLSVLTKT